MKATRKQWFPHKMKEPFGRGMKTRTDSMEPYNYIIIYKSSNNISICSRDFQAFTEPLGLAEYSSTYLSSMRKNSRWIRQKKSRILLKPILNTVSDKYQMDRR